MTARAAAPGGLRVILCLKFTHSAAFNEAAELKRALIAHERVLHAVEVSGSYDFMVEVEQPDLAAYQAMLDALAARFGHLIENYEASFVCRRYLREREGTPRHLWVPTATGMQRLDHGRIDKVTAEGDYVRVHAGPESWLIHATLRNTFEQLDPRRFLQLNRSLVVRIDFIERLTHDLRRWKVRLFDGTEHSIAKSRSSRVLADLRSESAMNGDHSSELRPANENVARAMENPVH